MRDYEEEISQWRELVGGFILSFGDIEAISFRLWERFCPDPEAPDRFAERVSKLIGEIRKAHTNNPSEADTNQELIDLLISAIKLADKRNTVAHNPVNVQVYEHTPNGAIWAELAIQCRKTDAYIDDAELKELAAESEDLMSQLYLKAGWNE